MWFPAVLTSALLFGIAGFILKFGAVRVYSVPHILLGLYITGGLGFLIYGLFTHQLAITPPLVIAGTIVGIGSTAGNILFMKALRVGPVSLTSPVVNLNIVLIVVMSVLVYGESPGINEKIGVAFVILCVSLLPVDPHEKISILDRKWYGMVLVAIVLFFFRNGGLKITGEMGLNNTMVLFYGYLLGVIWCWILTLHTRKTTLVKLKPDARRKGLTFGLIAGVFSFGGMQLYAIALGDGPASIVSPVFALNSLVTAILAITFVKERLSPIQIIAAAGVLCGIILLRIG
jgi:drug/metabolite transporter (DMT)-like permease